MRVIVEAERSLHVEHHRVADPTSTVVFVHGGGCSRRVWDGVVPSVLEAGRAGVVFDLRACGLSDQDFAAMSISELCLDISRVVDHLRLDRFDLVGWSLGGVVATGAAAALGARVAHLALVGSPGPRFTVADDYPWGVPAEFLDAIRDGLRYDRAAFYRGLSEILLHQDRPDMKQWLFDVFMSSGFRHDISLADLANYDHRELLRSISAPTLICHGRHDQFVAIERSEPLVQGLTQATLRVYEESGHAPFLEERSAFVSDLLDFLAQPQS
jgi:pimeloyl-ACP methyl ester carboxylesterase